MKIVLVALLGVFINSSAFADTYTCARMVYAGGWLKKYEYLGNTWGANTKKSGVTSSSVHSSIEKTTSSVDPGVSTKNWVSSMQYTSSWGECSMIDSAITMKMREDYIEQNADEIKSEIAMGDGIHVDSLAFVSGCHGINEAQWKKSLQDRAVKFYERTNAKDFASDLNDMIQSSQDFASHCSLAG